MAAAAAVCASLWTIALLAQHPETAVGAFIDGAPPIAILEPGTGPQSGPETVVAGTLVPPSVDSLIPPDPILLLGASDEGDSGATTIVIRDDEPTTTPAPATGGAFDFSGIASRLDGLLGAKTPTADPAATDPPVADAPAVTTPALMPYCRDEPAAPPMPYAEDGAPEDSVRRQAFSFWLGFFGGPQPPDGAHCQEDAHYIDQYSGVPYVGRPAATDARPPAKATPAFPGMAEESEPLPASHLWRKPHFGRVDFGSSPPVEVVEPKCDTMEQRPTDWKPYSLDPGPF
jgi:hypothetical protein